MRNYYETLINSLNIKESVVLGGFLKNPFSIISRSQVFVLSSLWEGMPCTLVEAICCRTPCIVTDFKCGSREIIRVSEETKISPNACFIGEYGILTPICSGKKYFGNEPLEESEIALAEGIKKIFSNQDLAKKIVGNNESRLQDFSIEEMVAKWKNVIGK